MSAAYERLLRGEIATLKRQLYDATTIDQERVGELRDLLVQVYQRATCEDCTLTTEALASWVARNLRKRPR